MALVVRHTAAPSPTSALAAPSPTVPASATVCHGGQKGQGTAQEQGRARHRFPPEADRPEIVSIRVSMPGSPVPADAAPAIEGWKGEQIDAARSVPAQHSRQRPPRPS